MRPTTIFVVYLLAVALWPAGLSFAAPPRPEPEGARCTNAHSAHDDGLLCLGGSGAGGRADFNGDGFTDLAIGIPFNGADDRGAVIILRGSPTGLTATGSVRLAGSDADERFGSALAAGDFDGNGFADLAVGIPGDSAFGVAAAGRVRVFYSSGPSFTRSQFVSQADPDNTGDFDPAETNDRFGTTLAAGDFNGDGQDDLAVGIPFEDLGLFGVFQNAGAVQVLHGSAAGLVPRRNQFWHQGTPDIRGAASKDDRFGLALATGDFNGDGKDDLAVGAPGEDLPVSDEDVGAVNVIYGSAGGLTATGNQVWTQASPDIFGNAEDGDLFGSALATGDLNGDGNDDLAVGVPQETTVVFPNNVMDGGVNVLYGSATGLTAAGSQFWFPGNAMLRGNAAGAQFGFALAAADFDGDGRDELAVGMPFLASGGGVVVLGSSTGGLTGPDNLVLRQGTIGLSDDAEAGDQFGRSLAWGDFNGDGKADLAIGVPREETEALFGTTNDAGAVHVIYGSATGLTSIGDQVWTQLNVGLGEPNQADDLFGLVLH